MIPPTRLSTLRLLLRQPVAEDAKTIFSTYAQDLSVVRYLIWKPHQTIEETRKFLDYTARSWRDGSEFTWAVTLKTTRQLIGMIGLRIPDCRADFGYVFARKYWGHGYATEAVKCIVDWASAQPGIHRIWAVCDAENTASARVLEKAGLEYEGTLRRWVILPNLSPIPRNCKCYAKVTA